MYTAELLWSSRSILEFLRQENSRFHTKNYFRTNHGHSPMYKHVQPGKQLIIIILSLLVILSLIATTYIHWSIYACLIILIIVLLFFYRLEVSVTNEKIEIVFGIGLVKNTFPIKSIISCESVVNPLWYGLGIHKFPGGIVYNVSGRQAVELEHTDGGKTRIGTDEPDILCVAIRQAIRDRDLD